MTKGDKILILLVILIAGGLFFIINRSSLNSHNTYASIQVNGVEVKQIVLGDSKEKKLYPFRTQFGYNLVEVEGKSVRVIEASCHDKLDVKQGAISKLGDLIVCIPNRFVIEIKSDNKKKDVDLINY